MYFTYSSLPVFSHNHEQQAAAHASNSLLPHTLTTHMRSPSLFPSAAHWHHTKCDDLDERGKHNCTFALHQVCVLIPSANSSGSDGKGRACAYARAFATHVYFHSCFAEIEQPPEWKPRRPNSFQQVAFAQ